MKRFGMFVGVVVVSYLAGYCATMKSFAWGAGSAGASDVAIVEAERDRQRTLWRAAAASLGVDANALEKEKCEHEWRQLRQTTEVSPPFDRDYERLASDARKAD